MLFGGSVVHHAGCVCCSVYPPYQGFDWGSKPRGLGGRFMGSSREELGVLGCG